MLQSLPSEVEERYREKTSVINNQDPYSVGTNGKDIPTSVSTGHVVDYLLHHKSPFSGKLAGSTKSLEAYRKFEAGYVSSVEGCIINEYFVIRGKVQRSMRLSEPPHCLWIIIEKLGSVNSAHCKCPVGISEACSHVAAVLYSLPNLHSVCINQKVTPTEVPALWMRPSKAIKEDIYHKVSDIDYGRRTKRFNDVECTGATRDDFMNLLRKMKEDGSEAAILRKFCDPESMLCNSCEEHYVPDHVFLSKNILIQNIFQEEHEQKSLDELRDLSKKTQFKLEQSEIDLVERLTRRQAGSDFWHYVRIGRITASVLKDVTCSSFDLPPPKQTLLKKICHPYDCFFETPATLYGRKNEARGKEYVKELLKDHESVSIEECGIFISKEKPYLAASPDLMVTCTCCGKISVEIKCPFRLRTKTTGLDDQLSIAQLANSKDSFIEIGNEYKLKKSHTYYFQVQAQIFISEADFGIFVVWSKKEQIHIIVEKDISFWLRCVLKSEQYFRRIIVPELLGNTFARIRRN